MRALRSCAGVHVATATAGELCVLSVPVLSRQPPFSPRSLSVVIARPFSLCGALSLLSVFPRPCFYGPWWQSVQLRGLSLSMSAWAGFWFWAGALLLFLFLTVWALCCSLFHCLWLWAPPARAIGPECLLPGVRVWVRGAIIAQMCEWQQQCTRAYACACQQCMHTRDMHVHVHRASGWPSLC